MDGGANESGEPGRMNQRERQHLDKYRSVVRMTDIAEWAGSDDAEFSRVHHLHVPVFPERPNHPPADDVRSDEESDHRNGKGGNEGPVKKDNFGRRSDQHQRMEHRHPPEVGILHFCGAAGGHFLLMALGDAQLDDAERAYGKQQSKKKINTYCHWRRRNSALKPGPKAAAMACSSFLRGRFSNHS